MRVPIPVHMRLGFWLAICLAVLTAVEWLAPWAARQAGGEDLGAGRQLAAAREPTAAGELAAAGEPAAVEEPAAADAGSQTPAEGTAGAPQHTPPKVDPLAKAEQALAAEEPAAGRTARELPPIPYWELVQEGGPLMYPIFCVSIVAAAFAFERMLGLRRRKVMPVELISALGSLAAQKGGIDPRQAYRLCQEYPSAAANVLKSMLLKAGRPHAEVEKAVEKASEREATRLYYNVRWLNISTAIAPMLGLLGTIQGMIYAFFVTANMPLEANKAEQLAHGIYTALVTTFAGLSVAIPCAIVAHLLEGRIVRLMGELDDIVMGLLPQLERFEGRLRVSKDQLDSPPADTMRPPAGDETKRKQPTATPPSG